MYPWFAVYFVSIVCVCVCVCVCDQDRACLVTHLYRSTSGVILGETQKQCCMNVNL